MDKTEEKNDQLTCCPICKRCDGDHENWCSNARND